MAVQRDSSGPTRMIASAKRIARSAGEAKSWFYTGLRKYRQDDRYDLAAVRDGFRDCLEVNPSDESLLLRICHAYSLSIAAMEKAHTSYRASAWWQQQRRTSLGAVMQALDSHDTSALQRI